MLSGLADEVFVPHQVRQELLVGVAHNPEAQSLPEAFRTTADPSEVPIEIERWDLGAGESSVLAFALANPGWEAVLDDQEARRCAASLGVPTTGTLGVVLRARQAGLVPAAKPVLEALLERGLYLAPSLVEHALELVGESRAD